MKFGYMMQNGEVIICDVQFKIYKQINEDYINGMSLKNKADELTANMIEYAPGKYLWNKNRVQRILTDTTYLGTDTHPALIDHETFDKVQEIMKGRNTQKNSQRNKVFSSTIIPIICGKCGQTTSRRHDARCVNHTVHICQNPECKATYAIADDELWEMVKMNMITVTDKEHKPTDDVMIDIRRLNNEIERDLQCIDIDDEALKKKIFECAALQYTTLYTKQRESVDFMSMKPHSPVFVREIKRRVLEVILYGKQKIRLHLKDGQIIGKDDNAYDTEPNC